MRILFIGAVCAALSACSDSELYVQSSFETPSSSGTFRGLDTVYLSGQDTNALGGYAYALGDTGGSGFRAHTGLLPGTATAPPPTTGVAVMTGSYSLGEITGIDIGFTSITGSPNRSSGALTLTADFANQTITGTSGSFEVEGTISGSDLGGKIIFGAAEGKLTGVVGATAAVGAFHGRSDTRLIAGGFVVD